MNSIELHLGDCIRGMTNLPAESVSYSFMDPPYGIRYQSSWRKQNPLGPVLNDNLTPRAFQELLDAALAQVKRILVPDAVIHVCGGWLTSDQVLPVLKAHFKLKGCIVWDKVHLGLGWWLRSRHEFVYLCIKGNPALPKPAPPDIWPVPRVPTNRRLHLCEKPVDLVTRAMAPHTRPGDLVADPFMGSAPVAEACWRTGRRFIGWELDPTNFKAAVTRVRRLGLEPVCVEAG